jgi:hypothetical protein
MPLKQAIETTGDFRGFLNRSFTMRGPARDARIGEKSLQLP